MTLHVAKPVCGQGEDNSSLMALYHSVNKLCGTLPENNTDIRHLAHSAPEWRARNDARMLLTAWHKYLAAHKALSTKPLTVKRRGLRGWVSAYCINWQRRNAHKKEVQARYNEARNGLNVYLKCAADSYHKVPKKDSDSAAAPATPRPAPTPSATQFVELAGMQPA